MRAVIHSDAERAFILANVRGHRVEKAKALLILSWAVGPRCAEIAGLEVRDVVFGDNPKLVIRAAVAKTGESREVPLTPDAVEACKVLIGGRTDPRDHLVLGRGNKPYTPHLLSERFRKIYALAGIKGSAYSGRRGLATRLVDNEAPLPVVQKVLGHRFLSSTQKYVGVTDNMMAKYLTKAA